MKRAIILFSMAALMRALMPMVTHTMATGPQANINPPELMGWTALHRAVRDNNINRVQQLLKSGSDVNSKDNFGNTPLYYAILKREVPIVELLLNQPSIDLEQTNNLGLKAADVAKKYALTGDEQAKRIAELFAKRSESLKEQAINKIVANFDEYKNRLNTLPVELRDEVLRRVNIKRQS